MHTSIHKWTARAVCVGLIFFLSLHPLAAQNATRDNPEGISPGTEGTDVGEAGRVIVTGVAPDESILPTIRPITSVYGTEQNIVDIPRDVSTITKEQVSFRQITSVDDLGQFASGTYSQSNFGAEGLPQIRGQTAEIYLNGQREHFYFNSFPPSFNGVESIDIVKGPGTAVFTPGATGLGGYVNLVTKQPFFDGQHTEITSVIGDYFGSPDNYGDYQWQLDNSGPLIKDKLAYRVSYLGRESSGYYRNTSNDVQDIFAALAYLPTTNLRFDLNGHFEEAKFNEVAGFNRVTQDLIDNHEYIRGPYLPGPGDPPFIGVVDPGPDGSYDDQKIKLHNDQTLNSPQDSAAGSRFTGQLITTLTLEGLTIKNSTFGDTVESRKFSAYGFTEYAPSNISLENRTEFQFAFDTPIIPARELPNFGKDGKDKDAGATQGGEGLTFKNQFDAGFSFRYEHTRAYESFINEPFSAYDISGNGPSPIYPASVIFGPERTIPGVTGYYNSDLENLGTVTDVYTGGVFAQDDITFTPWLSGLVGARLDVVSAQSGAPAQGPLVDPTQDFGTPGDPYSSIPATERDRTLIAHGAYFGSLVAKPVKNGSVYITYDRVDGTDSINDQGGIPYVRESDGSTRVAAGSLRQTSALIEGGAKVSLLHDAMYLAIAGYHQSRYQTDPFGNVSQISAHGIDVDFTYQPNKNFNVTSNFTWQAANYRAGVVYAQTGNYLDTYALGVNVDGNVGTGVGSPNYTTYPKGDYRLPDTPNILYNAYFIAQMDCGLGIGVGPQVTGDVNVNLQGTLVIPWQLTWNGFLFYKQKNYELRLSFFNILDARNWMPVYSFANNDLIYPVEPFHMNATVKFRF